MANVLDGILAGVREDLAERQSRVSLADLKAMVADRPPALDPVPGFRSDGTSIIAEVKRSSPSKGDLANIPDPAALAAQYAGGGAKAISVLTEQRRFKGSLDDLVAVRAKVPSTPILRKDFIVEEYQLWEARAYGADLALLMVVSLDDRQLADFVALSTELGLTPLVESHNAAELDRAIGTGAVVLGVNARDLTTLEVDVTVFKALAPQIPTDRVKVAESGVAGPADVAQYREWGADVVLVGEALVKSGNPTDSVRRFSAA
ncbi:indole-3-glycerol phosphate synthase TrpC [Micrococcus luteus]|uniref:indole-3-glycerol phosphate synthase TrpC n=1 Tax=Micrococcus luteus TaxID=1270 RepID=UPI0033E03DBF